jgi:hypothetical protein
MSDPKAQIVDTQNMSRKMPSMGRQRRAEARDMRLPGERLIETAAGDVKEGSFRPVAHMMDAISGPANDSSDLDRE